jgi:hypothetical protein
VELPRGNSRGEKKGKSIDFYRTNLTKLDKKLLQNLNIVYDNLHLFGYYDCTLVVSTIEEGFKNVAEIIERIKPREAA